MRLRALCAFLLVALAIASCSNDNSTGPMIVPPSIISVTPAEVSRAQRGTGIILGSNFSGVTSVHFGNDVTVERFAVLNTAQIEFDFSISTTAPDGNKTLTVAGTGGTATKANALTILDNRAPVPRILVNPESGGKNTTFTFDALSSDDRDGFLTSFIWDFGDGKKGRGPVVTHKYGKVGNFEVTLMVEDDQDAVNTLKKNVEVKDGLAPIPRFSITPGTGDINVTFHFDARNSHDGDGRITGYFWRIGSREFEGPVVDYNFSNSGTFPVTLTIEDNDGLLNALTKELRVENFNQEAAVSAIRAIVYEFFSRYSQLETLSPEAIVVNWSDSPECNGKNHEISIIERQKTEILETTATVVGTIEVNFESTSKAHALAAANFRWTEIDGSEHEGVASHDFTLRIENGRWKICNFHAFSGSAAVQKLFSITSQ